MSTRYTPMVRWIVAFAVLATGCTGAGSSAEPPASGTATAPGSVEANGTVDDIVDGDTVDITINGRVERVRLIGIDTPETKKPNSPVDCFGPEATAFTTSLLPIGAAVRVERDIVGRDDYGRLLGYVYLADDATFVNYEIIRQGYAQPLSIEPNVAYAELFVEAARTAERADIGLWHACRNER